MNDFVTRLQGQSTSVLLGLFFQGVDNEISKPLSLIIPGVHAEWVELSANGSGGIRVNDNIFDNVYHDSQIGFTFVGSLLLAMNKKLDGSEKIIDAELIELPEITNIELMLDNEKRIIVRFEDDELYIA